MKSRIVTIGVIACLTFFFFMVDHNPFTLCNAVRNVQVEKVFFANSHSAQSIVSATKTITLVTVKPGEKMTFSSETKPAMGIKHVLGKGQTADDLMLVAEANMKNTPVPVAIPVVTKEEADRINEEALEEKERTEPFYQLYQKNKLDTVCFEGTIRRTSLIPDPEINDYDNCLYALFVEIDALLSDVMPNTDIACEVIIAVPIMKDKRILENNRFFPGDKIHCICAEYDAMPLEVQRIQLSDDIQSYEHQQYYPLEIKRITAFQKGGNRNFSKREITILPIQTLPRDEKAAALRKERIQDEIARIEEEIKEHGGSFEKWKEEYKPIAEKYDELCKQKWKGWINDSYYAAYGAETTYQTDEYIKAITPYKKYLEDNNIDLIVLRIPSKGDFAARVLTADDFQENPAWVEHYYKCLKNDIEIIDPMPEMWKHRFEYPLFYFFHPDSENHPFEGQAFISAKVLSEVLKRFSFSTSSQPIGLKDFSFPTTEPRYFWPEGNEKFNPKENVTFKQVVRNNKTIGNLSVNSGSPFLFLSNSFFWFPRGTYGASVPGYTAFHLQHIPDWFYQDGTGNPLMRVLVNTPEALQQRHAVIYVGHPTQWNGYFPPFPKYLRDNPNVITLEKCIDFSSPDITNLDNGSFTFQTENGITDIAPNTQNKEAGRSFELQLSIPHIQDKNTCMLRINFEKTNFVGIRILDSDKKTIIDAASMSLPNSITPFDLSPNFFIPASTSRKIFIQFSSSYSFSIKNIELWYY